MIMTLTSCFDAKLIVIQRRWVLYTSVSTQDGCLIRFSKYIGFSAGGSNLLFENNNVQNGDDCLTVGNGAVNITFRYVNMKDRQSIHSQCLGIRIVSFATCLQHSYLILL